MKKRFWQSNAKHIRSPLSAKQYRRLQKPLKNWPFASDCTSRAGFSEPKKGPFPFSSQEPVLEGDTVHSHPYPGCATGGARITYRSTGYEPKLHNQFLKPREKYVQMLDRMTDNAKTTTERRKTVALLTPRTV